MYVQYSASVAHANTDTNTDSLHYMGIEGPSGYGDEKDPR